jgi:hypothetical protein
MQSQTLPTESIEPVSKVKLAVGAASLFLFIVGVKRTFDMDGSRRAEPGSDPGSSEPTSAAENGEAAEPRASAG